MEKERNKDRLCLRVLCFQHAGSSCLSRGGSRIGAFVGRTEPAGNQRRGKYRTDVCRVGCYAGRRWNGYGRYPPFYGGTELVSQGAYRIWSRSIICMNANNGWPTFRML